MTDSSEQIEHSTVSSNGEPSGARSLMNQILLFFATGLSLGHVPVAPGTFGSLWGLPLAFGLRAISEHPAVLAGSGIVLFLIGIPICNAGIQHYRSNDPKRVVFDEIAAFPFVFLLVPVTWGTAVVGFALFRLFDILKPWPVSRLEKFPDAWGVMLDDLAAGVIAGGVLTLLWRVIGPF